MSDLVRRLRGQVGIDHLRGCQGRCYCCECGYDTATENLLEEAATAIEGLTKELKQRTSTTENIHERTEP